MFPGGKPPLGSAFFLASREVLMGGLFVTQIKPKWVQNRGSPYLSSSITSSP